MKVSGALAWHPDVAMSQEEIDDFLSGRWVARLATIGPDGYPHVSPLWYYWDGRCVYMALTHTRRPCKHLRHNPRCSLAIDMDDRPLMGMRSNLAKAVIITGEAELTAVGSDTNGHDRGRSVAGRVPARTGGGDDRQPLSAVQPRRGAGFHPGVLPRAVLPTRHRAQPAVQGQRRTGGDQDRPQENSGLGFFKSANWDNGQRVKQTRRESCSIL